MAISSIFNDVIGPVMRGPSSSHSAAACRIGLLLRDLIDDDIEKVNIDYDPNGSLVTTHESQGTDMGLYGGLLGLQADDERIMDYRQGILARGIDIKVNYLDYGAQHPNTYRLTISNQQISHSMLAISSGGGMIEIQQIDGAELSLAGDFNQLLIYTDNFAIITKQIESTIDFDYLDVCQGDRNFILIKREKAFSDEDVKLIANIKGIEFVRNLRSVLPVLSRKNVDVPFLYCKDLIALGEKEQLSLWQLALRYESARGNISEAQVLAKMCAIIDIMQQSVNTGLAGTEYQDRILHCQSASFDEKMSSNQLLGGELLNTIVLYVSAIMEVKSSYGVIVAAPTAGSCGALPGSLLAAGKILNKSTQEIAKAMLASAVLGIFISEHSSFAAEVGGCQAECGAGSSMAAAGLVTLAGGNLQQCITAASLALQNSLGMICDPIGNRVEAPCLGRNVMAASNALSCANMALANYDPVVTYDEVVDTMYKVGCSISHELRCTALGGLSITDSAKKIEAQLLKFKCC